MTIIFYVLGSNAQLIAAAVATILASGQRGGALWLALGVIYIGLGDGIPNSYYPVPYCFYNGNNFCGTTMIISCANVSSVDLQIIKIRAAGCSVCYAWFTGAATRLCSPC